MQHHDRVRARRPLALRAVGVVLGLAAAVTAENEDVLPRQDRRASLQGILGGLRQLALLDLGGDREGDEAEQEPAAGEDQDPARARDACRRSAARRSHGSRRLPPDPPMLARLGLVIRSRRLGRDL